MEKTVTIAIDTGLEARPVAMLVQIASQYPCEIYLEVGSKKVNAKSIMGMMTLGLNAGEQVTIITENGDGAAAVAEIEEFLTKQ